MLGVAESPAMAASPPSGSGLHRQERARGDARLRGAGRCGRGLALALVLGLLTLAPGRGSAQSAADALQLVELGQSRFQQGSHREAVATFNQALAIALPLARSLQSRGLEAFRAGRYRQALADFLAVQQIWYTIKTGFFGRALAHQGLGDVAATRNAMRESVAANFLLAEAGIHAGRTYVALGQRQRATEVYVLALETNQEALDYFRSNREAAVAGRGSYLRGISKAALADLGSPRGDQREACVAFARAVALGYEPAVRWLASADGARCRDAGG